MNHNRFIFDEEQWNQRKKTHCKKRITDFTGIITSLGIFRLYFFVKDFFSEKNVKYYKGNSRHDKIPQAYFLKSVEVIGNKHWKKSGCKIKERHYSAL